MRRFLHIALLTWLFSSCCSQTVCVVKVYKDGSRDSSDVKIYKHKDRYGFTLTKAQCADISLVEIWPSFARAKEGEEGFFLYCREEKLSFLTLFPEPEAGWENALEADDPALWEALGNGEVRRTLRALYPLAPFQQVDRSYLTRLFDELGITDPEGVLEALTYLEVIRRKPCRLDGKETEFYHIYPHLGLLQLLLLGSAGRGGFATASFHPWKTKGVANKDR